MAKNSPSGLALLVRAPGEQRGITDGDDGDPETEVGLYSEAAFCLVGVGTGATEGSVQDPGRPVEVAVISVARCPSTVTLVTFESWAPWLVSP